MSKALKALKEDIKLQRMKCILHGNKFSFVLNFKQI